MTDEGRGECEECGQERKLRDVAGRSLCWKCARIISPTLPATEKQLAYLHDLQIVPRTPLNRKEASTLITAGVEGVPYYVADVWREIKGVTIDDCGIPWIEVRRLAALICSRHPSIAVSIVDIEAHRYFERFELADRQRRPVREVHLPVQRTREFEVVEDIIHAEWSRYRPSFLDSIFRLFKGR